jgi:hypothetical protein
MSDNKIMGRIGGMQKALNSRIDDSTRKIIAELKEIRKALKKEENINKKILKKI